MRPFITHRKAVIDIRRSPAVLLHHIYIRFEVCAGFSRNEIFSYFGKSLRGIDLNIHGFIHNLEVRLVVDYFFSSVPEVVYNCVCVDVVSAFLSRKACAFPEIRAIGMKIVFISGMKAIAFIFLYKGFKFRIFLILSKEMTAGHFS